MFSGSIWNTKTAYLLVFLSLAGWAVFAYLTMAEQIQAQQIYAKIINLSGKQRMLSQKTALITTRIFLQNETGLLSVRDDLIHVMKQEHDFVVQHLTSAEIKKLYLDAEKGLANKTNAYLHLLEHPPVNDLQSYALSVQQESFELLPLLNQAVYAFESESNAKTQALKDRETFILIGTIFTLFFESIFVVLPVIKKSEIRQRAIERERKKFKVIMDLSSDAIFIIDILNGNLIEYSLRVQQYLGYSDLEMESLNVLDWDKGFSSIEEFRNVTADIGKSPVALDRIHTRKDGSSYIAAVTVVRVSLDGEEFFSAAVRDVTEQKRDFEIRMQQKAQLQAITDSSQDAIVIMNPEGSITFWNPAAEKMLGYNADDVLGKALHSLICPERYLEAFRKGFEQFKQDGTGKAIGKQMDIEALHKDGHEVSIDVILNTITIDNQTHSMGIIRDVTEKKAAEKLILEQKEELESIFNISLQGIAVMDLETRFIRANKQYANLMGYPNDELLSLQYHDLIAAEDLNQVRYILEQVIEFGAVENHECNHTLKNGEQRRINSSIALMPGEQHFLITSSDVTERYQLLQRIREQSVTDELTQLQNRKAFHSRMQQMIAQHDRLNTAFSILLLDVDHFKAINDTFGHQVGDEVLVDLSKLLHSNARKTDNVYRFGGEEFVILLTGAKRGQAEVYAEKLRKLIQNSIRINRGEAVTVSIGVAEFNESDNLELLIKQADDNLYKAKRSGRNCVVA